MGKFQKNDSIADFQNLINDIYGLPDDRLFSLWDIVSNQERFTMRALKGIRKGDRDKIRLNLLIAFSWLAAFANRLHIDIEEAVWSRFPAKCSYCNGSPCSCKKNKSARKAKIYKNVSLKPGSLKGLQKMFAVIYPPESRNLFEAGVHLAEEMGELSEAVHCYLGEHRKNQFAQVETELADYISCVFGVANSTKIDVAAELTKMYAKNCHACHVAPCECNFTFVGKYKS